MSATEVTTTDVVDGRRLRRHENRTAVLDALVALFDEGVYQPSVGEIAARAGISARSLFRYFEDVDDLSGAAIERQLERARPLLDLDVGPRQPAPVKIEHVVERRVTLFEAIAPAARGARACAHHNAAVARQLHDSRTSLRHQVAHVFAPELRGARHTLLPAVDALLSFETYELMRGEHRLS